MIAVCLIKDKNLLKLEKIKDIWLFIGTGVCSIVFFNACYFSAMQYLSLSAACVLLYTAPAMVVIMSRIFFKEAIIKRKIFALIVSFIGCIFMTGLLSDGPVTPKGILLGIGAGFGYSLYSIIGSVALKKYKPFTVTTYTFIIAALCLIPFGVKGGLPSAGSSKYIILMSLISTLAPYILYTKGLEALEPGKASIIAFFEPVMATVIGFAVFKEYLSFTNLMGIILIFISIILLNTGKKEEEKEV